MSKETRKGAQSRVSDHSACLGLEWQSPGGDAGYGLVNIMLMSEEGGFGRRRNINRLGDHPDDPASSFCLEDPSQAYLESSAFSPPPAILSA